jgi:carbonic anhydrase
MKFLFILLAILLLNFENSKATRIQKRQDSGKKSNEKHWGYRNEDKSVLPNNWHEKHPNCYGKQQSPINIESHETIFDQNLTQLVITGSFKDPNAVREIWNIKNNGHSGNIFKFYLKF